MAKKRLQKKKAAAARLETKKPNQLKSKQKK